MCDEVDFNISASHKQIKIYFNLTVIHFTRNIEETSLQKNFFSPESGDNGANGARSRGNVGSVNKNASLVRKREES